MNRAVRSPSLTVTTDSAQVIPESLYLTTINVIA